MMFLSLMLLVTGGSFQALAGEVFSTESRAVVAASGVAVIAGAALQNESHQTYGLAVTDRRLTNQLLAIDEKLESLRNPKATSSKAMQRALTEEALELRDLILREADDTGKLRVVALDPVHSDGDALKVHRGLQAKKNRYLVHLAEVEGDTKAIAQIRYNTRTGVGLNHARAGARLIKGGIGGLLFGGALSYATDISIDKNTVPSQVVSTEPPPKVLKASN